MIIYVRNLKKLTKQKPLQLISNYSLPFPCLHYPPVIIIILIFIPIDELYLLTSYKWKHIMYSFAPGFFHSAKHIKNVFMCLHVSVFCSLYCWVIIAQSMNIPQFINSFSYWLTLIVSSLGICPLSCLALLLKIKWHYLSLSRLSILSHWIIYLSYAKNTLVLMTLSS